MKTNLPILKYLRFNKVLQCLPELEKLAKSKTATERNYYLKNCEDCLINSISEIALNCLKGKIPLKSCDFKKLNVYKNLLRQLASKSPVKKRRRLLIQKGGFISVLIPPAISLIASLVGDLISNKIAKK